MRPNVTAGTASPVLRALLPLVLSVCLLVAGLAATPGGGTTAPAQATGADVSANHTANVTLYDAGDAFFEDAAAVEAAVDDGRVTDPGEMAVNETLLVVIESERLASAMDERNGSTTERFAAALDGPADLYLVQTNPTTMVTRTFALVGADNATAYRDGETVYALLDTGALSFRKKANEGFRSHDSFREDRFAVDFGFDLYEPPWEPPGDPPWGPTFVLSDERFVTPTPESTPTDSPTQTDPAPTDSPTPTTPPLTPGLTTSDGDGTTATTTERSNTTDGSAGPATKTGTAAPLYVETSSRTGQGFTLAGAVAVVLALGFWRVRRARA